MNHEITVCIFTINKSAQNHQCMVIYGEQCFIYRKEQLKPPKVNKVHRPTPYEVKRNKCRYQRDHSDTWSSISHVAPWCIAQYILPCCPWNLTCL